MLKARQVFPSRCRTMRIPGGRANYCKHFCIWTDLGICYGVKRFSTLVGAADTSLEVISTKVAVENMGVAKFAQREYTE